MKHGLSLPAFMAPASAPTQPAGLSHPPLFTTSMVLSPLVAPVGIIMGCLYLCAPKWRGAGAAMLTMGLVSAMLAGLVFLSLR